MRARKELRDGAVVIFGSGIPDKIATILAAIGERDRYDQTIEHET